MPVPPLPARLLPLADHSTLATHTLEKSPALIEASALLRSPRRAWAVLLLVFFAVHAAALFAPSLLDDADATHADAAQHMAETGDWVTLRVDGVRYLEKPPMPYWLAAIDYRLFGYNVFATHLPLTLAVLGSAILAWVWARRAFNERAAFYAALGYLTAVGIFLYTRFFIPEAILSLLLGLALWAFLTALEDHRSGRMLLAYAALGLAVLAKGLVAPVFFLGAVVPYLLITGEWRRWREFRLLSGACVFLPIAAPWHVMAALRNPDQGHPVGNVPSFGNVHGFLYFYFVNEHFLRFLGKRYPHDYNRQEGLAYWLGQLAWLFPWSLFVPAAVSRWWGDRGAFAQAVRAPGTSQARFRARTTLLLALYAAFILLFFSLSTNQEYYTFPAWFALLLLLAGSLSLQEAGGASLSAAPTTARWLQAGHWIFAVFGVSSAAVLLLGLWVSRRLPPVSDIGSLLAHRGVGDYTLSTSHLFDLTGPSLAALRLPALLAAVALLLGPASALWLRRRGHYFEATSLIAFTMAAFLVAAHLALVRFEPLLSSRSMADTILRLRQPGDRLLVYGDLPNASSVLFYTRMPALLVNGRSSSMIWGSNYPDVPPIFLEDADLLRLWGPAHSRNRLFLFVPSDSEQHVEALLGRGRLLKLQGLADDQAGERTLYTDRPL